jgi:hypothetical protein
MGLAAICLGGVRGRIWRNPEKPLDLLKQLYFAVTFVVQAAVQAGLIS